MTMARDEHRRDASLPSASVWRKLSVFVALSAVCIVGSANPTLRAFLRPEALDRLVEGLGWKGPLALGVAGIVSPLLFLPRWPIAVVSGLVYGVFWGTCLANASSLGGAWFQYVLARSTLAPAAGRWLAGNRWGHLLSKRRHVFCFLVLLRAFPLSNFVATNLLCGTLRLSARTYLLASAVGMLPSTILYAAWGKFTVKPSSGFAAVVVAVLAFLVGGTLFARRFLLRAEALAEKDADLPRSGDFLKE